MKVMTTPADATLHFLVVYDRAAEKLLSFDRYPTQMEALEARFDVERRTGNNEQLEIVVLSGGSEELIRTNHAQYFETVEQILQRMADRAG